MITGNMALFNARFGDQEAFLRSKVDKLLTQAEYSSFAQLPSFAELQTALSSTHLGPAVQDIKESGFIKLRQTLAEFLAADITEIQVESESSLHQFIEMIKHRYIIENVFLVLIRAVQSRSDGQSVRFHPLGQCEQLKTLTNAVDEGVFRAVLESTPVSCYFQEADADLEFFQQVQQKIEDKDQKNQFLQELEVCKQRVMKQYYKRFVQFCKSMGGNTWEAMRKLLGYELDVQTIMLRLNMLKSTNPALPAELYPEFGELYPFTHDNFANATDYDSVANALTDFPEYRECFDLAQQQEKGPLEIFKQKKVAYLEECLNTQFNLGCVYAYLQLREIEAENVFLMVQGCVMAQQDAARFQLRK